MGVLSRRASRAHAFYECSPPPRARTGRLQVPVAWGRIFFYTEKQPEGGSHEKNMGALDRVIRLILAVAGAATVYSHMVRGTLAIVVGVIAVIPS